MAIITFLTYHQSFQVRPGTELLTAYKINPSMPLKFGCCKGQCATCAIKVVEGEQNLSKMTKQEKETLRLKNMHPTCRLACQCALLGDVQIESIPCHSENLTEPIQPE